MRSAVIALTRGGAELAIKVQQALKGNADVFLPEKQLEALGMLRKAAAVDGAQTTPQKAEYCNGVAIRALSMDSIYGFSRLQQCVKRLFVGYDSLIFIMATGIVVRHIAPLLQDKLTDPAVLVLDEQRQHVISLLSGHMGGANQLTRELAAALGSEPVITTATDVNGLIAPDAVAGQLGMKLFPRENIKLINSTLLQRNGKATVHYYVDEELKNKAYYELQLENLHIKPEPLPQDFAAIEYPAVVLTSSHGTQALSWRGTENVLPDGSDCTHSIKPMLCLYPRLIVAGVGCRRGVGKNQVMDALQQACAKAGIPLGIVDGLASAELKKDEAGLLETAKNLGIDIEFYSAEALQSKINEYSLEGSSFVAQQVGAGNVCEAAALCRLGRGSFLLPKTRFEKVTVSLIWEK